VEKNYATFLRQQLYNFTFKSCFLLCVLAMAHAKISAQVQNSPYLVLENLDKFPSNDRFVFSRIQFPFSRDSATGGSYNSNHDSLTVRIHNNGISTLVISNFILSNNAAWQLVKLKGVNYNPATSLPLTITSGGVADLTVKFVAVDAATRVKIFNDTLTIVSNDGRSPAKPVYLNGLWQWHGESSNEPYAQEIIQSFGYTTQTGFEHTDPNFGDSTKLKGDEVKPSYFAGSTLQGRRQSGK